MLTRSKSRAHPLTSASAARAAPETPEGPRLSAPSSAAPAAAARPARLAGEGHKEINITTEPSQANNSFRQTRNPYAGPFKPSRSDSNVRSLHGTSDATDGSGECLRLDPSRDSSRSNASPSSKRQRQAARGSLEEAQFVRAAFGIEGEGGEGLHASGASSSGASLPGGNESSGGRHPNPSARNRFIRDAFNSDDEDQQQILRSTFDSASKQEWFPIAIPPRRQRIISKCMRSVWGILCPRAFQLFAVFCMVYLSEQFLFLIRKTAEGKSLVLLTTAAMLRGVTIVLVPLIGLGSDQVNKCFNLKKCIEAWHVDENKGSDFYLLCERLLAITKNHLGRTAHSIILFCSPQSLKANSHLTRVFEILAGRDLITSIFIDEAHTIPREGASGSNFRPEFDEALSTILRIRDMQSEPLNVCAMSGTLPQELQGVLPLVLGELL